LISDSHHFIQRLSINLPLVNANVGSDGRTKTIAVKTG